MTIIRVKGFHIFNDRHGKKRCYHRRTGTSIDLKKTPIGTVEFFAECERVRTLNQEISPRKGTLGLVTEEYRKSQQFHDLADATKADYLKVISYLRSVMPLMLSDFDNVLIIRIRDKALEKHKRRFANYVKQVLSIIFSYAVDRGYMATNPAKGIKNIRRDKHAARANRPWNDSERFSVLTAAPWHLRVPIALCMYASLRESDAMHLPKTAIREGVIEWDAKKNGNPIVCYIPTALAKILSEAPHHNAPTIAANMYGKTWTTGGFRASWRKLRIKLELEGIIAPGLTIHGLRHTMANILREEGKDDRTIADALSQKTIQMAQHYSRGADLRHKMKGVQTTINEAEIKRREVANLTLKAANPTYIKAEEGK